MSSFVKFYWILLIFVCSSCVQKRVIQNYIEDSRDTTFATTVKHPEPVIQPNDLLQIQIYSISSNPAVDQLYNLPAASTGGGAGGQTSGYLVNQAGNIEMPRIGKINAAGLTKIQLGDEIKKRLQGQLTEPSVIVRFLNFRITVLGEVGNPGVVTVPAEKITVLEAVGMVGGITDFGKKNEVKILRYIDGKMQMGLVDLTSSSIFQSPFYHLQQNDIVMVEQTRQRIQIEEQQRISQQVGFVLTIVTGLAVLYSLFRRG